MHADSVIKINFKKLLKNLVISKKIRNFAKDLRNKEY